MAVGVDYRLGADGRTEVAVRGWEEGSGRTVVELLAELEGAGVAAVVATAIDRDGTLGGPDVDGLRQVLASTAIPVIASGGVATAADIEAAGRSRGRSAARRQADPPAGRGHQRQGAGRRSDDGRGGGGRMRTVRVIPCLDVDAGRVVKGVRFTDLFDAGDPVELAARYDSQGADELVFLDITASSDHRRTMVDVVSRTAEAVFIPFTVGGGIRSVEDARLAPAGRGRQGRGQHGRRRPARADRRAGRRVREPVRGGGRGRPPSRRARPWRGRPAWEVFTHGGRTPTGLDALEWCRRSAATGAGEILLTSMDRDGTRDGFDLELTRAVAEECPVPVVASGGVGTLDHLVEGAVEGRAEAVLAASIFHLGEFTVAEAKRHLQAAGVAVRPA